ncbi:MAG: hypothetical protein N2515_00770 [Deltaproteobacteria bacterium]|nr:hypothetical protein [Deltaproteobacteria bacterium]
MCYGVKIRVVEWFWMLIAVFHLVSGCGNKGQEATPPQNTQEAQGGGSPAPGEKTLPPSEGPIERDAQSLREYFGEVCKQCYQLFAQANPQSCTEQMSKMADSSPEERACMMGVYTSHAPAFEAWFACLAKVRKEILACLNQGKACTECVLANEPTQKCQNQRPPEAAWNAFLACGRSRVPQIQIQLPGIQFQIDGVTQ